MICCVHMFSSPIKYFAALLRFYIKNNKMTNNSILDVVNILAQQGKWNVIFNETSFSLYSFVYDEHGDVDPTLSRWLTSAQRNVDYTQTRFYSWATVNDSLTQFLGKATATEGNYISFMDLFNNPNNLLLSYYGDYQNLTSYTAEGQSTVIPVVYAGTYNDSLLLIKLPIGSPIVNLVENSIATFTDPDCYYTFGLSIIAMGSDLSSFYCNYSYANLTTTICINFCAANVDVCLNYQKSYCSDVSGTTPAIGTGTAYCNNLCTSSNRIDCDASYGLYCEQKLATFSNDVPTFLNDNNYHNTCACYLPNVTLQGYRNTLQNTYNITVDVNSPNCFFPVCLSNSMSVKPTQYKTTCGNCPFLSGCILSATIDYNGNFVTIPVTNQSSACNNFNQLTPDSPNYNNEFPPPTPNACLTVHPPKRPKKPKQSHASLIIIIAVPTFLVAVMLVAVIVKKNKKK